MLKDYKARISLDSLVRGRHEANAMPNSSRSVCRNLVTIEDVALDKSVVYLSILRRLSSDKVHCPSTHLNHTHQVHGVNPDVDYDPTIYC